jgi:hypothetical protein
MWRLKLFCLILVSTLLLGTTSALGDAMASAYVQAQGTCSNGSASWVVGDSDTTNALVVTVKQTITTQGSSNTSTFDVSLSAGQQKPLGCAVQTPAPMNVPAQFSWQVQAARYQ